MPYWGGWWTVSFGPPLILVWTWYRLESAGRCDLSRTRRACFNAALLLAAIVLVGPLPVIATEQFWAHMVQHIALMMLIAPLLVLGSPVRLILASRYPPIRRGAHRAARLRLVRQLLRPGVGFVVFFVVLVATHFSPLANAGMTNSAVHGLELLLFLSAGCIYYYPLMEGNPQPHVVPYAVRVISLFAMMVPETMVGFFLYASSHLLHDSAMTVGGAQDVLTDQHLGGALMWSMGMIIDSVWVVLAIVEFFASERQRSESLV